jgi:ABC-type phosphate transport system ATPase subunit
MKSEKSRARGVRQDVGQAFVLIQATVYNNVAFGLRLNGFKVNTADNMVTHNLQQARRISDYTGFLYVDTTNGERTGYLVEFGESQQIFEQPAHTNTQEYIRGEFG